MSNTENIIHLTKDSTADLLETLNSFSPEELNTVPFEGSWTGGQVADHLLKSRSGMTGLLQHNTSPTERAPDEKVQPLKDMFLNFDTKFQAPDELVPSGPGHNKDELYQAIKQNGDELNKVIAGMDLDQTCKAAPFPGMGELTRQEWLSFTAFHTHRHTRQMNNILKKLRE
jgi:hypothetical protein